jgi:hypothetical protein
MTEKLICWRARLHGDQTVLLLEPDDAERHKIADTREEARLNELEKSMGEALALELEARYYRWKGTEPDKDLIEARFYAGQKLSRSGLYEWETRWVREYRSRTGKLFCPLFAAEYEEPGSNLVAELVEDEMGLHPERPWKVAPPPGTKIKRMDERTEEQFMALCVELKKKLRTNTNVAIALHQDRAYGFDPSHGYWINEERVYRALLKVKYGADAISRTRNSETP